MRVLQVSPTMGQPCGIALFADRLARELEALEFEVTTVSDLNGVAAADLVLVQHHVELLNDHQVKTMCSKTRRPAVLCAHSDGIEQVVDLFDGVLAMSPGLVPHTDVPTFVFPLPVPTPQGLSDRNALRARFGLPVNKKIIGTCGYLKFERQLVEILSALLPQAVQSGWYVQLLTSPWYLPSPGLLDQLDDIVKTYPSNIGHQHRHLEDGELNLRLQACDLLWCWTAAQSSPYGSGVASDLYASGSRIVAADKMQHEHILNLPNVVRAPGTLEGFVEELLCQMQSDDYERHDPSPVSWSQQIFSIASFLQEVRRSCSSRKDCARAELGSY